MHALFAIVTHAVMKTVVPPVPTPTPTLTSSNHSMQNIVLDVDNTLVHTIEFASLDELLTTMNTEAGMSQNSRVALFADSNMVTVIRPHCMQFLDYCLDRFKNVMVWSTGTLLQPPKTQILK